MMKEETRRRKENGDLTVIGTKQEGAGVQMDTVTAEQERGLLSCLVRKQRCTVGVRKYRNNNLNYYFDSLAEKFCSQLSHARLTSFLNSTRCGGDEFVPIFSLRERQK